MKFSIVTPNYNYGRFLKKALESVYSQVAEPANLQTCEPANRPADAPAERRPDIEIEHIVMDGGSTDESVQILKDWAAFAAAQPAAKAGRYSFAYVSEPDKGQTDAINKGLRRATGDIVAWLNADEWYLPGKLALVAADFAKHPKTEFLYGEPLFVDKEGNPIRVKWDHWFSKFVLLCHGCHISSCCSFWRHELLEQDGCLDTSFKVAMDYEYWCRLVRRGRKFRFLPHVIGAFIWHDGNVSSEFSERGKREVASVKRSGKGFASSLLSTGVVIRILDILAHQWRRFLVIARLALLPRDSVSGSASCPFDSSTGEDRRGSGNG